MNWYKLARTEIQTFKHSEIQLMQIDKLLRELLIINDEVLVELSKAELKKNRR